MNDFCPKVELATNQKHMSMNQMKEAGLTSLHRTRTCRLCSHPLQVLPLSHLVQYWLTKSEWCGTSVVFSLELLIPYHLPPWFVSSVDPEIVIYLGFLQDVVYEWYVIIVILISRVELEGPLVPSFSPSSFLLLPLCHEIMQISFWCHHPFGKKTNVTWHLFEAYLFIGCRRIAVFL